MKVWIGLYAMVWLVFLELLVAIDPQPPSWAIYVHASLGILIILLAASNYAQVRATSAPGRTKRTVRATLWLTVLMAFLGVFLWVGIGQQWSVFLGYTVWDLVHVFHVVNALAIFAQAASAATAFDMWEDKEFERGSPPGIVPAPPPVRT
jgi:hypothetical protein